VRHKVRTTRSSAARRLAIALCGCAFSICCSIGAGALAAAAPAAETAEWTELDKANGIAVYTRPFRGSAFPEVRASGDVCATLPQLVAFVEDVAAFEQWIPDTAEARLLERPTPRTQVYYIRTSMPWPVKDRDMIYRLSEIADPPVIAKISVGIEGMPDYLPVDPRAVVGASFRPAAARRSTSTCTSNRAAVCRAGLRGSGSSARRPRCCRT
jgi:hypothetical protein